MNPAMIAQQMEKVLLTLDELVDATRVAGVDLAEKERKDKVKGARARIQFREENRSRTPKFTTDEVADYATVQTEEESFDHSIAKSTMVYTREALRAAETRLDVLRSLGAAVRGAGG